MKPMHIAVIGAGPAGIYASDMLLREAQERGLDVHVDLFERLPAPYGLVRYGVAPDHPRIKAIVNALRDVLDKGQVRLFGNVNIGTDLTFEDLRDHYDAVVAATGAVDDAPLPIPGIDLPGSFGAASFVNWFDGHPDVERTWPLSAAHVGVIGNGNVALDVSRMLAKHVEDLRSTEIAENVEAGLAASKVTDVHIFGRRGPAQTKFTPLELRELGEVPDVDIVLDPADFVYDEWDEADIAATNQRKVIKRVFDTWLHRDPGHASRRIHFHFFAQPVAVLGDTQVEGLRVARMVRDELGRFIPSEEYTDIPLGQLYRAVGYYGAPLAGFPFDVARGTIPNDHGRVLVDGAVTPGQYTTGWIKRGPIGLIGSTKSDALETVRNALDDLSDGHGFHPRSDVDIQDVLLERGVAFTTALGWQHLDHYEMELGEAGGRERVKVVDRDLMIEVSRRLSDAEGNATSDVEHATDS